jgi:hypothetical protein
MEEGDFAFLLDSVKLKLEEEDAHRDHLLRH